MHENELDKLAGTRLQLEVQVNTLESANLNAETMAAMKKAASALKDIHGNMYVDIIVISTACSLQIADPLMTFYLPLCYSIYLPTP